MFSQQGGAGEVQLALASGQSFWAPCLSTHHPRGHKQEHFPPSEPPVTLFPLLISKLTPCHTDTLTASYHLPQVSSLTSMT